MRASLQVVKIFGDAKLLVKHLGFNHKLLGAPRLDVEHVVRPAVGGLVGNLTRSTSNEHP